MINPISVHYQRHAGVRTSALRGPLIRQLLLATQVQPRGMRVNSFTVRVDLHAATLKEYEDLHQVMAKAGFSRTVARGNGVRCLLPNGEYNFEGNCPIEEVLRCAQAAASAVGCKASFLVTESAPRIWDGLPLIFENIPF